LGQPFGFTRVSNPLTQHFERGCLFQPIKALLKDNFSSSHYSGDFWLALLTEM
jgi:hypothetical protein